MAWVVAVGNTKGGVGKSTTAINLADAYYRDGYRTILIDHDHKQGTASKWKRMAEENERDTFLVTSADSDLQRLIKDLRNVYDVIIVDGPGHLDKATASMIAAADMVLIPIQPSSLDLWACEELLEWIDQRQMITGGEPEARFLLSRCHPNERVAKEEVEAIASQGVPVLTSRTVQRVSYARTLATGETVFNLNESDKARLEFTSIYGEVNDVRNL